MGRVAGLAAALLAILIAVPLGVRAWLQGETRARSPIPPGGIEQLESVEMGGVRQWILIRGHRRTNPVLLYLNTGPSDPAFVRAHQLALSGLERDFTVVYWEQRGTMKSYYPAVQLLPMTVEQFNNDTVELSEKLAKRFGQPKIFLAGHAWGSLIGMHAISLRPDLYHAYVGIAQLVNVMESDRYSMEWTISEARRRGNGAALAELQSLGKPPFHSSFLARQRRWLREFGGIWKQPALETSLLTTPEYSLSDLIRNIGHTRWAIDAVGIQYNETDLANTIGAVHVPAFFLMGRHDRAVPSEPLERWLKILETTAGYELIWFENSAHMIPYEEPQRFAQVMRERVLPKRAR